MIPETTEMCLEGTVLEEVLRAIIAKIVQTADPDKIILFGSRSSGQETSDSDFDLMVLKQGITHRRALAQQIYRELADMPVSVDIVVETPEKAESYRSTPGFVYAEVMKGTVVYER